MAGYSAYLQYLLKSQPDVGARYLSKISVISNQDPFKLDDEEFEFDLDAVPDVTSIDIISYLVLSHSFYSLEQMKAYKSLESYKYFEAGFVEKIGCKKVNEFIVMKGKVKHSQRMTEPSLDAWIIFEASGGVNSAHCTCMAGTGEVCSHVGALLYAAEYASKLKENRSCTDLKASWLAPATRKVPAVPISQMEWPERSTKVLPSVPPARSEDLVRFLEIMKEKGCTSALMRIVEPFCSEVEASDEFPPFSKFYDETNINKPYEELLEMGKNVSIPIDDGQIFDIEKATRSQRNSAIWFQQRMGRITASYFKAVCRTTAEKPSISLVKSICYSHKMSFSTKATRWGISHEKTAVAAYARTMQSHVNFQVNEVGLVISCTYPQFGASPDGLIYCDCCGGGCLEVKCPYGLAASGATLENFVNNKQTCLIADGNKVLLDRNHGYYFQVQLQMFCTSLQYCDFVLWSPNLLFIERIPFNSEFVNTNIEKALCFHQRVIIPEILGRFYTRRGEDSWCICKGTDDGRPMIECCYDECKIKWYHLECIDLHDIPDTLWLCEFCK